MMNIVSSEKFNYWFINENVIMFQRKNRLNFLNGDVLKIASNTVNTWQKERKHKEVVRDTVQGKIAEDMFEDLILLLQSEYDIRYLSYDNFRNDHFKKHAPIDGILYESSNTIMDSGIAKILKEVSSNEYGRISTETREFLNKNKLYTVEIKSSRVPDKDYEEIDLDNFKNKEQQLNIIEKLRKRDFLTYPRYTRLLGMKVHNFTEYCEYVKRKIVEFSDLECEELESTIISKEIEIKSDIYTRIFMDWNNTESVIGYLTGYALKEDFFETPRVINMFRRGKSENALYFVCPIRKTRGVEEIVCDDRLWCHLQKKLE